MIRKDFGVRLMKYNIGEGLDKVNHMCMDADRLLESLHAEIDHISSMIHAIKQMHQFLDDMKDIAVMSESKYLSLSDEEKHGDIIFLLFEDELDPYVPSDTIYVGESTVCVIRYGEVIIEMPKKSPEPKLMNIDEESQIGNKKRGIRGIIDRITNYITVRRR